jgi:diadenosine tetraphosphatase ApaH/serine/threonine PP2A family protein phosphatase
MSAASVLALVSDVHGNEQALRACLADADAHAATQVWCLGDVVGYGARPLHCLTLLRERAAVMIRGNHEQAVLDGPFGFNPLAAAAIRWTRAQFETAGGEALAHLRALPERVDAPSATLVHGSPAQPLDEYVFAEDAIDHLPHGLDYSPKLARSFRLIDRPCFVGHTHVAGVIRGDLTWGAPSDIGGTYDTRGAPCIVNVGSVGQPRDGDTRASYALFDGQVVTFRRVEYDVEAAARDILATRALPPVLAQRLVEGW